MGVQELAVVGLVGSGVGAALGLPMVWSWRHGDAGPRVLGGALLLLAAVAALISARLAGLVPASAGVGHAINLLGLASFPLAVAYTRLATGRPRVFTLSLALPAAAYLTALATRAALGVDTQIRFVWILPVALGATAASARALWQSPARPIGMPVPPSWVVGFLALVNVAQIARMDWGHVPAVRAVVPLAVAGGFIAMVARLSWRSLALRRPQTAPDLTPAAVPRYEHSALDEATARALLARIEEALDANRLFARPDLTLQQLAAAAGTTPHQVSEALNRFGGIGFRDLVNRRRVQDVKTQLADPDSSRYTIEGMGAAAGFRSRSALYAVFQRSEGMTPTAYRSAALARSRHPAGSSPRS